MKVVSLDAYRRGRGCLMPPEYMDRCDDCPKLLECQVTEALSIKITVLEQKMLNVIEVGEELKERIIKTRAELSRRNRKEVR